MYDVFVKPFVDNYIFMFGWMLFWFGVQHGSHFIFKIIFPNNYGKLSKDKQLDWGVRTVSVVHAIASWPSIYIFLFPSNDLVGVLNESGKIYYNHYAFSSFQQNVYLMAAGYFMWDTVCSIYYKWGAAYIVHGLFSLGVFYFSLHPFLHLWGCFYHGIFELSTPWIHISGIMEIGKYNGIFKTICDGLFAISFTIVRIILGISVSIWWWNEMINLIISGNAHSNIVVCYYLVANGVLMCLQVYWFTLLVKAILGQEVSDKADKKE